MLSFPRFNLFPLAWIALVPWLVVLPRLSFRQALQTSFAFGLFFFAGLLSWVAIFGYLPWLLLSIFQALFILLAGIALWFCRNLGSLWKAVAFTSFWTITEWLRGQTAFGFTWGGLGYSQSHWLSLIQIASVTGVPGITFLVAFHNSAIATALSHKGRLRTRLGAPLLVWALIIGALLFGDAQLNSGRDSIRKISVAIIQPSDHDPQFEDIRRTWSEEELEAHFVSLEKLTYQAAVAHPNLIVLPESALPVYLNREPLLSSRIGNLARSCNAWLLIGAAHEKNDKYYNAAYLFSPAGKDAGHYAKVQLVPFGEFVPGRKWLPGIGYYPIREYDLTPGSGFFPLNMDSVRLGIGICFESIFPKISRKLTENGGNILVVITNDGWFKKTAAPAQHEQMAVFRAVENHRWLARAATTGISCVVSPQGRILKELSLYQRGVTSEKVGIEEGESFYTRHGDWVVVFSLLLAVTCLIQAFRKRAQKGQSKL